MKAMAERQLERAVLALSPPRGEDARGSWDEMCGYQT